MNYKLIIFFVVSLLLLIYLRLFLHNRKKQVELKVMNQKTEMSLGWLAFTVFLDGAIFALVGIWLFS
ncbi:hypothetical protein COY07_01590 [Candidatus Peregrinibacteria bacterium CG_4_10_14_0_2_um_filter_43_11]|nr:MAG: hypothetical protein COY07_01590 [Candidatus Peregrinibacteria bacterium CG_4_10_14_0_2_um_filter_43_11]